MRRYGKKIVVRKKPPHAVVKPGDAIKGKSGLLGVIVDGVFLKGQTPESVQKPVPPTKWAESRELVERKERRSEIIKLKRAALPSLDNG